MAKKDSPYLANVEAWANGVPWAVVLGETKPQYKFHPSRRWKFDLAWPDVMIAFECEGGAFVNGRHTRGSGFTADCEKYSNAAALGWAVIRGTPGQIKSGLVYPILEYVAWRRWDEGGQEWLAAWGPPQFLSKGPQSPLTKAVRSRTSKARARST